MKTIQSVISEAADEILDRWDEWNAVAGADAQVQQDPDAWTNYMHDRVSAVVREALAESERIQ